MQQNQTQRRRSLIICLLIPLAVGGLSSLLTRNSMDVYERINLPPFAPPSWIFPVAWGILYLLMGYGSWLCLEVRTRPRMSALTLYAAQLLLNFFWPILFFNMEEWFGSLLLLIALLMVVIVMTLCFAQLSKKAGLLQIPYCLWLCFATYLNWMIFLRN